jgi:two-component system NtrC family sensor kinase
VTSDNQQNITAILEAIEEGVYLIDEDYNIEYMNYAMVKLYGEWQGKKCYEVLNKSSEICTWCKAKSVFEKQYPIRWEFHNSRMGKIFRMTEMPVKHKSGKLSKLTICSDITDSKRYKQKAISSGNDYMRLFETVGCGVYISSKKGNFLDVNPALLKMLDYPNKSVFLKLDIKKDIYATPEKREEFQKLIEESGRVIDFEVDFKNRTGQIIPVLITAHLRLDEDLEVVGYEGIIVDQSHRKAMEQELRKTNVFMNRLIHSSPNPIMASDMQGTIMVWNHAAEESLGYKAQDVIDKMSITELYPNDQAREVMKLIRSAEHDEKGILRSHQLVFKKSDGVEVQGKLSASILYDDMGREIASVGIFVDIQEKLKMKKTIKNTQDQLFQSEKLAAMGRLTSQIAHEINNPLYGIMNTLELVKTEIPKENRRRKILDMAISETVRLADMLKKMLSFSKPDQENKVPIDINTVLDEILMLHEKQLRENDIRINHKLHKDLPRINASKNHLRQVFLNMVKNASDAMPRGGDLYVETYLNEKYIHIDIKDTGTGITKENINKIFDSFFTTKGSVKGVGLGLSVCYGLIQDHGGDIDVESTEGEGTTFTIKLPIIVD